MAKQQILALKGFRGSYTLIGILVVHGYMTQMLGFICSPRISREWTAPTAVPNAVATISIDGLVVNMQQVGGCPKLGGCPSWGPYNYQGILLFIFFFWGGVGHIRDPKPETLNPEFRKPPPGDPHLGTRGPNSAPSFQLVPPPPPPPSKSGQDAPRP